MAPLHLYSWDLLELSPFKNRLFLFELPQSLFEQIEHRSCNCLKHPLDVDRVGRLARSVGKHRRR
jgi:hypothetical protein